MYTTGNYSFIVCEGNVQSGSWKLRIVVLRISAFIVRLAYEVEARIVKQNDSLQLNWIKCWNKLHKLFH